MTEQPEATKGAAFFDLDKTILAKSSSFAFARPFYKEGLIGRATSSAAPTRSSSTSPPAPTTTRWRRCASTCRSSSRAGTSRRCSRSSARPSTTSSTRWSTRRRSNCIEEHKAAGRDVIIISSSGTDIVEPIGERLGVDLAIGTQVAIEDGQYTGEIVFYAYGPTRPRRCARLAEERGYDLAESYAYSDSHTDLPMLEVVGHPFAVNPDTELRKVAVEREWPILDFRKPVAMREQATKRQAVAAGRRVALGAVALGLTWYARRRGMRA